MKKQEGFLDSSDGKNKLHVTRWLPDQESPNVWVQLVHGMNEHMGRYEEFAAYLAEHGIAVMGHDCIGHGKTAASLEDRVWREAGTSVSGTGYPESGALWKKNISGSETCDPGAQHGLFYDQAISGGVCGWLERERTRSTVRSVRES